MRLFVGLDLPENTIRNLEALLERLRPTARIHWSPPANLHITTKFIGEWPDERVGEVKAALAAIEPGAAIPVRVQRLGFFPNPHAPRVFWCGIEAPGLEALAAATDRATAALGIPPETRAFSPHLTLARIKERLNVQPLRETIAALPSLEFGSFVAQSFFLYQSSLRPTGSVYTKLAGFPLAKR
ncbi:MAG: RNA 2',3'-cyclic phosphodiesterase [Bryobacteraceae bacterium]|jgi:2'-5' RNA ligase